MPASTPKLFSLSQELTNLDTSLQNLLLHVRFLTGSIENFEERILLEQVNQLRLDVVEIGRRIGKTTGELRSVARSSGAGPDFRGRLKNQNAKVARTQQNLGCLDKELRSLAAKAETRINTPGRYGDASANSGPIFQLINLLQTVGEVLAKVIQRR